MDGLVYNPWHTTASDAYVTPKQLETLELRHAWKTATTEQTQAWMALREQYRATPEYMRALDGDLTPLLFVRHLYRTGEYQS